MHTILFFRRRLAVWLLLALLAAVAPQPALAASSTDAMAGGTCTATWVEQPPFSLSAITDGNDSTWGTWWAGGPYPLSGTNRLVCYAANTTAPVNSVNLLYGASVGGYASATLFVSGTAGVATRALPLTPGPQWITVNYAGAISSVEIDVTFNSVEVNLAIYTLSAPITTPVPGPPSNLTGSAAGQTQVNLSWGTASGQVSGYWVYEDSARIATVTGTSFTVTGLAAGTSHSFYVTAFNQTGESSPSNTVTVRTTAALTATPTGLTAHAYNSYAVSLVWTANADNPTSYHVYRNGSLVLQLNTAAPAAVDQGLSPGHTYQYAVASVNADGVESAPSAPVSITLPSAAASSPAPSLTVTPSVHYAQPLRFSSAGAGGTELAFRAGVTGFPVATAGTNTVTGSAGAVPGGYTVAVVQSGVTIGSTVAAPDGSFTVTTSTAFAPGAQLSVVYRRGP